MKQPTTRQHKSVAEAVNQGQADSIIYVPYIATRFGVDKRPLNFTSNNGIFKLLETGLDELVFAVIPDHFPFYGKTGLEINKKNKTIKRKTLFSLSPIDYHPLLEQLHQVHSIPLYDSVEEGEQQSKILIKQINDLKELHSTQFSLEKQLEELSKQTEYFKRLAEQSIGKKVLLRSNMSAPNHLELAARYLGGSAKIPGHLQTVYLSEDPNQLYEQMQLVQINGKSVSFVVTNYGSGSELERQAVVEFIHGKPYSAKADTSEKQEAYGQEFNKILHGDEAFKKMMSYVGRVPDLKLEIHKIDPYDGEHDLSQSEFLSGQSVQSYLLDRVRIEDEYHSGRFRKQELAKELSN